MKPKSHTDGRPRLPLWAQAVAGGGRELSEFPYGIAEGISKVGIRG